MKGLLQRLRHSLFFNSVVYQETSKFDAPIAENAAEGFDVVLVAEILQQVDPVSLSSSNSETPSSKTDQQYDGLTSPREALPKMASAKVDALLGPPIKKEISLASLAHVQDNRQSNGDWESEDRFDRWFESIEMVAAGLHHPFHSKVAGVSFLNADGSSRQEQIAKLKARQFLWLEHDRDNAFSKTAVAVNTLGGNQIGFLEDRVGRQVTNSRTAGDEWCAIVRRLSASSAGSVIGVVIILIQLEDQWAKRLQLQRAELASEAFALRHLSQEIRAEARELYS